MARDYLEARIPEMDSTFDTFELVITAAALQAAGSSQLSSIFALMQQRIRGCALYLRSQCSVRTGRCVLSQILFLINF